jgi:hypothetical protein
MCSLKLADVNFKFCQFVTALDISLFIRVEGVTAVAMGRAVFWDVTLCGSCRNILFGITYGLHNLGDKNRRARNDFACFDC